MNRSARILLCISCCLLAPLALAIVTAPLPTVPGTTPATTTTLPANSAQTQALIDQLFDKASFDAFQSQTPSSALMDGGQ